MPTQAQLDAARAQAQRTPESTDAHFELAMLYARTCFLEEGWESLKRVQTLDAGYADKVVERYGLATEADPYDLDARFRLAFGYYFQGKKDLAKQEIEHLAALTPQDPWPYNYLGFMVAEQNQLDLAQQHWQRALSLDPNNAVAHYLMGQVHYRQGRFMQAAQALAKAVSLRAGSALKP
jgi:tetratricopeptide (TPR) repeat protein